MKKRLSLPYSALAIAYCMFNVIAFAIPTEKNMTFWVAYFFTFIAFALQIVIWKFTFRDNDNFSSRFLRIPLVIIGLLHLVIQIITFAVVVTFHTIQAWIVVVVCVSILGSSIICLIGSEAGRREIDYVGKHTEKKIFYIRELKAEIDILARAETNIDTQTALTELSERLRFSDPISNENLEEIEKKIEEKIKLLKNTEEKRVIIAEINLLLIERNEKIKLYKGEGI